MDISYFEAIKRKTVVGVTTLIARTFLLQIVTFIANFVLTIILLPADFGVYFIVSAIIAILNYFSDIGLAAALVQKREEPTQIDYTTTFTIQQILVLSTVLIFLLISPTLALFFNLNSQGLWLMRALLISFFLSSLKTIPTVILERKLEFGKKVIPQILETVTFYIVAIILALRGFGITSFGYAAISRGLIGLIAIHMISPWKVSLGISKKSAKGLLSFGLPLQGGSVLALFKDDLLYIFLGKILSARPGELGFIGWAKKWAEAPLRSFMDNIIAVSFPVYSRISHDDVTLRKAIEKTLFFTSFLIFPTTVGLMLIIKPVALLIPHYYTKWSSGFLSFYFFSFSAIMASLSSPLVQVLNSLGKAKTTFTLMTFWTILTWLLIPFMVFWIGFNGVAISAFLISLTGFLPSVVIRRYISFSFISQIIKPFVATILMAFVTGSIIFFLPTPIWTVILSVLAGALVYCLIMYYWSKEEILPYIQQILHAKS